MSTTRRLLIISPAFHGYWRAIERAFASLGYAVRTHVYDDHRGLRAKVAMKERELSSRLHGGPQLDPAMTHRACTTLAEADPDLLLLVKADGFGPAWWELLEQRRTPTVLWLYDELRRTRHTPATLSVPRAVASYSPLDVAELAAQGRRAAYVPLAFDTGIRFVPQPSAEVAFVGARYPARDSLLATMHQAQVPIRTYGRDWSPHVVDRLRTWRVGSPGIPAGRELTREHAYAVMAGAPATLNIHGDQDGFTMRTFEACGVGGVQLIDRADVGEHYEPGVELAVFASAQEAIELATRARTDRTWAHGLRERGRARTLAEHTFEHRARALEALWA